MTRELKQALLAWLNYDLVPMDYSLEHLLERVGAWFQEQKIEPLETTQLNRLLRSEMHSLETAILNRVVSIASLLRCDHARPNSAPDPPKLTLVLTAVSYS